MTLWRKEIIRYQLRDAAIYWLFLPGCVLATGQMFDHLFHWSGFGLTPYLMVASLVLIIVGSALISAAMRAFSTLGQGTANPRRPPVTLVKNGVYAICRHPMFFGYDLAALGVVLLSHSLATLWISFPGFILGQILFLRKEERYLARRYKDAFAAYQQEVPFLLPIRLQRPADSA